MTARLLPAAAPGALTEAVRLLRADELLAIPTETVYGLAVLPREAPLARLLEAKRRSPDKGIQLLVDSLEQVYGLADLPPTAERLAQRFWPGPLTLVLELLSASRLPELLTGGRPTVGVRLPDHEVPRSLARLLGPLAASSANVSGEAPATTAQAVFDSLAGEVALILDDGPVRGGVASSVVACPADGTPPIILREGALSRQDLLAAAG
ncbi:MAG TPA: L-threonylcarbamoyladenylate synthase [Candidatus Limnocylindria bacterium]|nr:L-threonylcarbamoyladenylate synthase [Candidatus Limnocylindria bacterium]